MSISQQTPATTIRSHIGSVLWIIAPWMLLATTLRTFGVVSYPSGMLLFLFAELVLFIAFLLASQRWIEATGGNVGYSGLDIVQQLAMAKGILWRLAAIGLVAHYGAWLLGLKAVYTTPLVYGFDAVAFNRFNDFTLLWGPLMGTLAFLMLVDQSMGRNPTFLGAISLFRRHWRYLVPVIVLLIPVLAIFNSVQWTVGPMIRSTLNLLGLESLTTPAVIFFLFAFASLRLAGTIALLTFALKASYGSGKT